MEQTDLISRLDGLLVAKRPAYHAILQPGAADADLNALEVRYSCMLPMMFRRLYRWRNGQDPMSSTPLQFNRAFMTLNDICSTKDELDSMIGFDFEDPRYWRRGWIPFLHNGGGSYLCLDMKAEDGGTPGQLVAFWKADKDRPVEYSTVAAWLEGLVSSMENDSLELC